MSLFFKICIFGNSGVGKTSLTQRFLTGIFKEKYQFTIGTDFYVKKMNLMDKDLSLNIWDFAGEERFRFLMPGTLVGSEAVIFMYDISRYQTFESLNGWIDIYETAIREQALKPISIIVGAKTDLEEIRAVPRERALLMVKERNIDGYIECSSKSGTNVEDIFDNLALMILKRHDHIKKIGKELKVFYL